MKQLGLKIKGEGNLSLSANYNFQFTLDLFSDDDLEIKLRNFILAAINWNNVVFFRLLIALRKFL